MRLITALRLQAKEVVAFVGAGGKTALMFRLADELAAAGRRVVTTMTTKIFAAQMARAPVAVAWQDENALSGASDVMRHTSYEDVLWAQLAERLARYRHVLVTSSAIVEQDKVQGLAPQLVDRLAGHEAVDAVIVEADGSRRKPFKAPASHEPVIPTTATLVVPVVGMDVVGKPLTADHVHRPEIVAALAGVSVGDPVTPEVIATILAHPQAGAKGVPADARLIPFLNKVEDEAALRAARRVARLLLAHPRVESVLIGAAEAADPVVEVWGRVAAVVLAAGQGKRFGALKQLLPWHGVPLAAHVADQALACADIDRVCVTIGAGADEVRRALAGRNVTCVPVPDWAAGQSRSVQAGLRAAAETASAVLFLLADQPGVTAGLLSALIQRHRETLAPIVAPRYRGQRGNPVLFDRAVFGEFAGLAGDIGARPIIQAHQHEVAWVDWPTADILQDIDTVEDYRP